MSTQTQSQKTKDDEQNFYICGRCKSRIDYLKSEEPPDVCPECGWEGMAKTDTDIPNEIKLDLTQY